MVAFSGSHRQVYANQNKPSPLLFPKAPAAVSACLIPLSSFPNGPLIQASVWVADLVFAHRMKILSGRPDTKVPFTWSRSNEVSATDRSRFLSRKRCDRQVELTQR